MITIFLQIDNVKLVDNRGNIKLSKKVNRKPYKILPCMHVCATEKSYLCIDKLKSGLFLNPCLLCTFIMTQWTTIPSVLLVFGRVIKHSVTSILCCFSLETEISNTPWRQHREDLPRRHHAAQRQRLPSEVRVKQPSKQDNLRGRRGWYGRLGSDQVEPALLGVLGARCEPVWSI